MCEVILPNLHRHNEVNVLDQDYNVNGSDQCFLFGNYPKIATIDKFAVCSNEIALITEEP